MPRRHGRSSWPYSPAGGSGYFDRQVGFPKSGISDGRWLIFQPLSESARAQSLRAGIPGAVVIHDTESVAGRIGKAIQHVVARLGVESDALHASGACRTRWNGLCKTRQLVRQDCVPDEAFGKLELVGACRHRPDTSADLPPVPDYPDRQAGPVRGDEERPVAARGHADRAACKKSHRIIEMLPPDNVIADFVRLAEGKIEAPFGA